MTRYTEIRSEQRQIRAHRVAATLYGVIAIMTAELAVQPSEFSYTEAALGALLTGFAMTVTHIFVEVVKKETEIGTHLPIGKAGAIMRDSLLVMLFPATTAILIVVAALTTARWTILLDAVLYLGMVTVFMTGFLSSYLLGRRIQAALLRGTGWLLLSLVLVAAKYLA
jgi:hypothetical protein